jgi:hypothetical protein
MKFHLLNLLNTGNMILLHICMVITTLTIANDSASGQVPDTAWTRTYGARDDDFARAITKTDDGGYIIVGYTGVMPDNFDVYAIRIDPAGNVKWQTTYGGKEWDTGSDVVQCDDSGFIIAGYTNSFGKGWNDAYIIRTDGDGTVLWQKTFGGSNEDGASSVIQTTDGGFVIAGETMSFGSGDYDVFVVKIDDKGNFLWKNTIGGTDCDGCQAIQQTYDGGYIIVGDTKSSGKGWHDMNLIKLDAQGKVCWSKTYGGKDFDCGEAVKQTRDRGFIITGWTRSFGAGLSDVYVVKTDREGEVLWERTYGGTQHDFGFNVEQTFDGGFLVIGDTKSFGAGWYDVYVIRTDERGDTLWTRTYGGTQPDEAFSLHPTRDGGYLIAGSTKSFGGWDDDVYLIKLHSINPPRSIQQLLIHDSIK